MKPMLPMPHRMIYAVADSPQHINHRISSGARGALRSKRAPRMIYAVADSPQHINHRISSGLPSSENFSLARMDAVSMQKNNSSQTRTHRQSKWACVLIADYCGGEGSLSYIIQFVVRPTRCFGYFLELLYQTGFYCGYRCTRKSGCGFTKFHLPPCAGALKVILPTVIRPCAASCLSRIPGGSVSANILPLSWGWSFSKAVTNGPTAKK